MSSLDQIITTTKKINRKAENQYLRMHIDTHAVYKPPCLNYSKAHHCLGSAMLEAFVTA